MKICTFIGGVHPDDKKDLSQDFPIRDVKPKTGVVVIPVTQGGAPNSPIVKVGDHVARGQIIASSDKFMSAPVHSSVSGTVTKIANHVVTGNTQAPCITIKMDDSDDTNFMEVLDPFNCTKDDALKRIKDAGIVGMGGASFPTHVKLNVPAGKTIDYVLINAAECEPYLTCDERILQEYPDKVIDGLAIVCHIIAEGQKAAPKGVIALEDNKSYITDILNKMIGIYKKENVEKVPFDLSVQLVKTKYPQGSEKFIISAVTGREIPSAKLPADAGCVVCNVGTVCAISDAFRRGEPLISRALTISGEGVDRACDIRVPIGTIITDLTPELFNIKSSCTKVLSGGPMMGFAMYTAEFPVTKGTSGVTFLMASDGSHRGVVKLSAPQEDSCIGCGKCINSCPMRLYPVLMVRAIKAGDYERAKKFGLMDCIECGSCAFECPAHLQLVQRFRLAKGVVRAQMAAQKAAKEAEKKSTNTSEGNNGK